MWHLEACLLMPREATTGLMIDDSACSRATKIVGYCLLHSRDCRNSFSSAMLALPQRGNSFTGVTVPYCSSVICLIVIKVLGLGVLLFVNKAIGLEVHGVTNGWLDATVSYGKEPPSRSFSLLPRILFHRGSSYLLFGLHSGIILHYMFLFGGAVSRDLGATGTLVMGRTGGRRRTQISD